MLHHSHRASMRQALLLVAAMAMGLVLVWLVPFWGGFGKLDDYVPIHTWLEMVSVVISVLVFASGWNAYSRSLPHHAVILGCAFLGVALLDFSHAMSFSGMPRFVTPSGPEKAIHFWLSARLLAALGLLTVAVRASADATLGRARYAWLFAVLSVVAFLHGVFLFHPEWIPPTYDLRTGLTPFKISLELMIMAMNLFTAGVLWRQMRAPLPFNAAALFGAVCVMALSECFFTLYAGLGDVYNVLGHFYKLVAYLFLYRAVFVEAVVAPYRELSNMRDQLKATLDAVPDLMLELDLHGRYHDIHSSSLDKLVRPAESLLGRTIHEVLTPDQARVVIDAMTAALEKGTSSGAQMTLSLPQGERCFELSVSRKGEVNGQDTRFIVLSRDVTERKRGEAALLEQQAMIKASEAKSQFLSRVSHELRTPLNAVIGFAQLLLHDAHAKLAAGQRLHVEYILRAGQHLLEMINDILDLTRIESGDAGLTIKPVRLGDLLADCLPMIRPQAETMGVTVRLETASLEHRLILADERRLKQVLLNVLSNAVKYNRVGGAVDVWCELPEGGSSQMWVRVRDMGKGISADQMKGLFEPFNRLGADRLGIEGTGLGLVISRLLIHAMGGDITLESAEGEGTTVTLSLPLVVQAATPAQGEPVLPAASTPRTDTDAAQMVVLCVEDNPLNAALLRAIFDLRPGVKLLLAEDGGSALERLKLHWPDLVLIDINLPDMSGVEVLQRIRALPQGAGLTCVAMSADVSGEPLSRAKEQGFADFWAKPLDVDAVLLRLDALLATLRLNRGQQKALGQRATV
jgi:PAS domain S-box-containing protein